MRKVLLLAVIAAAAVGASPAYAAGPIQTAVYVRSDDVPADDTAAAAFFARIKQAGATAVRLTVSWRAVAPVQKTAEFQPTDPADPGYRWDATDRLIQLAVDAGLTPLVDVLTAPGWASQGQGNRNVVAADLGAFATAITTRYSGTFEELPRVRYWLVWNEPNLTTYLAPQVSGKKLVGAARYRSMVNAFATAAHTVSAANVVVAGLVAPFTFRNDPGPLKFMEAVLCMSDKAKPTCAAKTQFDVWAVHPYTSGGPRHHALRKTDVSLGDLPKAKALLNAAVRAHHVVSTRSVQFWITEFSWDSKPPDSSGVPLVLEAQWVSEALYRVWQAGVSMFTWFLLRDDARPSPFQSGLYFQSWKAKPALAAFRFPFFAQRKTKSVYVWGRTPGGVAATVTIERKRGKGWKPVASMKTNGAGVFTRTLRLRVPASSSMRARMTGATSIAFPLKLPPDRFVNPFGS